MNIVVIGLGSMGRRRIRLIKKYDPSFQIFGVDSIEDRRNLCQKEFGIIVFQDLADLFNKHSIDCAFVCTAPLSHSEIITQCLRRKTHVFTELNLVNKGYTENTSLANEHNLTLFLSSTFLYREEIKRIQAFVEEKDQLLNYIYHVGQYLPDWHPWESYKEFFVGDKRTNGCRELFAIELPWISKVFGEIKSFHTMKSKMSDLKIDYNDNYMVFIEHSTGHKGMLAIDVVSRRAVRNLEIYGEKLFLQWDGSPEGLKKYDYSKRHEELIKIYDKAEQLEQYSRFIVEDAYYNEIVSFFAAVSGNEVPIYSFEMDETILKIIDEIEG